MALANPVLPFHETAPVAMRNTPSSTAATRTDAMPPHPPATANANVDGHGIAVSERRGIATGNASFTRDCYLHWCIDSNASDTLLFPLKLLRIDDVTIIQKLRATYKAVKGFRKWISLTDIDSVRFVLFKRGVQNDGSQDLIVCLKEDMPPKTDTNYQYLSSEPPNFSRNSLHKHCGTTYNIHTSATQRISRMSWIWFPRRSTDC
ncbi:hypothetical protein ONS95_012864 [Cadophora gregata]|uniref:uncharacterized protein n=1 Tax=Cadophora gregata TaxID=51156 RepID=UPI0026DB88CE|nr:uncharacterized protein ONS95_012864 [Cadophora gregata]KAK0101156.1 hypothetical protein ONS96_006378 [Cadophora gregata f. sp. sojae]KAK0115813.1 hypothetical protein ONS95_012864 [Cadophora gregata]